MKSKEHLMKDENYTYCGLHLVQVGGWTKYHPDNSCIKIEGFYCKTCLKRYKDNQTQGDKPQEQGK